VRALGPIKVVPVSVDEPLRPIEVEERYTGVLLVVMSGGSVVGEIRLPALTLLPVDLLRRLIAQRCGDRMWRQHLTEQFLAAARPAVTVAEDGGGPTVSVVVCTRDRTDQLRSCLESLLALDTAPHEILVVDNAPSSDATRLLCEDYPVRYVLEPLPGQSRARNRGILETTGELIAFTDDDCVVDSRWLDGLGETFADPLVSVVTGYGAPAELETPSQILFELHGGFERGLETHVFHGPAVSPVQVAGRVGVGANMILRRSALARVGLFEEDLGPGSPARAADETYFFYRVLAKGDRILFDPARIIWHHHRRDMPALRKILFDYGVAVSAYLTRCLIRHREPAALRVFWWWWTVHLRQDLWRILRREAGRIPFRIFLAEVRGSLVGPWRLWRSQRSRRGIPPLTLPRDDVAGSAPAGPIRIDPASPPISVVIPSHDRRELLVQVLEALAAQDYPADRFDAVVVLDSCTDGSADVLRSLELPFRLRTIEHEARNSAASRNRGVREAENPVVVFLDDDVVPDAGTLAAHAEAHRLAVGAHAALGSCPPYGEGRTPWELILRSWWEDHYRRRAETGHLWSYTDFASANASLARAVILEHPYDETFPTRREDWELGLRLLEAGVTFEHCAGANALHYLDTTFPTALANRRGEGRADALFAVKHPHARSQLPVAAFLWSIDELWFHDRVRQACDDPAAYAKRLRSRLPRLDRFAALHMRGPWRRGANLLLREAYVLGLVDALETTDAVTAFAASIFDSAEAMRVTLDEPSPLGIPSAPGSVEIELALARAGVVSARVVALDPGGQWDWHSVTSRVVSKVGWEIRDAVVREELDLAAARRAARTEFERFEEEVEELGRR
jgi:glycosyltransferase involved in cell wall biosynthesis